MARFIKRLEIIFAYRWFKEGDQPDDDMPCPSPETVMSRTVRSYQGPDVIGKELCGLCGVALHEHGWIGTSEDEHTVCPGDWIVTEVESERGSYPCTDEVFEALYQQAEAPFSYTWNEKIGDFNIEFTKKEEK